MSSTPPDRLVRILAPHFVAGAVFRFLYGAWICIEAAPILGWARGKNVNDVYRYTQTKGWTWEP